ncbi:hypothetical protein DPMN_164395 [Dreissena polymorpha]|uniref:Uncharacterized protein n=1 Tax=Dreissena polymorpha TaxID=45954 RepID=A0A9D4IVD7_DREPO|nr:hypothetical protein DPMN_164395 [Dreissena polymorpha]
MYLSGKGLNTYLSGEGLNLRKGKNGSRKDFMTYHHTSYVARLGINPVMTYPHTSYVARLGINPVILRLVVQFSTN